MLAIGRALIAKPKVLMLDEPSLGLAPKVVDSVFERVNAIHEDGVGILIVEQNARRALGIADHAYVLELGQSGFEGCRAGFSWTIRASRRPISEDEEAAEQSEGRWKTPQLAQRKMRREGRHSCTRGCACSWPPWCL